jgi:hypothetical protein
MQVRYAAQRLTVAVHWIIPRQTRITPLSFRAASELFLFMSPVKKKPSYPGPAEAMVDFPEKLHRDSQDIHDHGAHHRQLFSSSSGLRFDW